MTADSTLHVLTPSYRPMGGVVKLMDYVTHARALGHRVSVWSPETPAEDDALFSRDKFAILRSDPEVEFHSRRFLSIGDDDLMLISLPTHYGFAARQLVRGQSPERIVHLIQNVRHVNPSWLRGEGTRVLTRPAARISINRIVADAIQPWLDPRTLHEVINLGHDTAFFEHHRSGPLGEPLRVAFTTWKSDVGDRVERALAGDERFLFRAVRESATWEELRDLYVWSDVFLCTPGPEEGMYLPGLEAMAAGALVVTPDVGGNMAYCRPDDNCLLVDFGSVESYVAALHRILAASPAAVGSMRQAGWDVTGDFDLAAERQGLARFLADLRERIGRHEGA